MRISESALIRAQRTKLGVLEEAARACGDRELLRVCAFALDQGPQTFDITLEWVGGRVRKGDRRTRIRVPTAEQYVVLHGDEREQWMAGEVGARLPKHGSTEGFRLLFEEVKLTARYREAPWLRAREEYHGVGLRDFFFCSEEVAPFTVEMGYAPSGLWSVLPYGAVRKGAPLFAAESEEEAISLWKQHTRRRIPRSEVWAIERIRSSEGRERIVQPPSHVILVSAAERTICLTQAVRNRPENGDRVPFQELYTSPLFRRSLAQARTLAEEAHIHLLSTRYGLIQSGGWHTRVTSDDVPLNDMSLDQRQDWAWRVNHELLMMYGPRPRAFLVFAGSEYVQALQEWAPPNSVRWTFEAEKAS